MQKSILITLFIFCFNTYFSQSNINADDNKTPTYPEIIEFYKALDIKYSNAKLVAYGTTDAGLPLHVFIIDQSQKFDPSIAKSENKTTILINNGIHPGESCGIDASMKFAEDILSGVDSLNKILEKVVVCIIPVYNIGGTLNRNSFSRANQNGPEEYGFRGNSKNLDLNRDFIKCDSKEAQIFSTIFHQFNPEILVDTHVSNGADYQYNMTLLSTIPERLNKLQSNLLVNEMLPYLFKNMDKIKNPICPYVNTIKEIPDDGIAAFLDNPRFATGYASLFNTIGFTTEAHTLKPYKNQVESTYQLLRFICFFGAKQSDLLVSLKKSADKDVAEKKSFDINYILDTTYFEPFQFMGYEANYKLSNVTKLQRLYYDRNKPFTKEIKYFSKHIPTLKVTISEYYIIPQAYAEVIQLLKINNVKLERLKADGEMEVEASYITKYKDIANAPYENHYLHTATTTRQQLQKIKFYKGDVVVKTDQKSNHFLAETLEPSAYDSYFNWNYFDGILQQKEWFSDYVFEDLADSILRTDKNLEANFRQKQSIDSSFANSQWEQLYYIYKNSIYFEKTYMRYPVMRILKSELLIATEKY